MSAILKLSELEEGKRISNNLQVVLKIIDTTCLNTSLTYCIGLSKKANGILPLEQIWNQLFYMISYFLKGKIAGCVHLWFNEAGDWRTAQPRKTVLTVLKALTSFTSRGVAGRHRLLPTLFCLSANGSGFWRTTITFLFFLSFTKHFLSVLLLLGEYSLKCLMITFYASNVRIYLLQMWFVPQSRADSVEIMEQKYRQALIVRVTQLQSNSVYTCIAHSENMLKNAHAYINKVTVFFENNYYIQPKTKLFSLLQTINSHFGYSGWIDVLGPRSQRNNYCCACQPRSGFIHLNMPLHLTRFPAKGFQTADIRFCCNNVHRFHWCGCSNCKRDKIDWQVNIRTKLKRVRHTPCVFGTATTGWSKHTVLGRVVWHLYCSCPAASQRVHVFVSRTLVSPVPSLWISVTDDIFSLQSNGQIVG